MPSLPNLPSLQLPLRNLVIAGAIAAGGIWILGLVLPRTSAYHVLVSQGTSGRVADTVRIREQSAQIGREGIALSVLRPGGKAQFGEDILDVMSQGEMIARGTRVRIMGHSAREAVVEAIPE
jgi:hypothetical protein